MKVFLGAVLLVVLSACGSTESEAPTKKAPGPEPAQVTGTVKLSAAGVGVLAENGRKGAACWGQNGFEDIAEGASVVVRDDTGKTVGVADLGAGEMATGLYAPDAYCAFTFAVPDVKTDSDFLSIQVANRPQNQFKREDSEGLTLSLG